LKPIRIIGISLLAVGIIEIIIAVSTAPVCNCPSNYLNCPCGLEQIGTVRILLVVGVGKVIIGIILFAVTTLQKPKEGK